jgi:hypothetical protein
MSPLRRITWLSSNRPLPPSMSPAGTTSAVCFGLKRGRRAAAGATGGGSRDKRGSRRAVRLCVAKLRER